jgi:hypothetical protein
MDIVDMAIHPVICHISDFYGNRDFKNSQMLDQLQIPVKKFRPKYASLSKIFCCITKVE